MTESPPAGELRKVAETLYGTPVYCLPGPPPPGIIPKVMMKRSQGQILPAGGSFARYLAETLPLRPACVIIRTGRFIRIFKLSKGGEVFTVTARSIMEDDRKRLVVEGILRG